MPDQINNLLKSKIEVIKLISSFNSACDKFLLGILQGFAPGEIQSENDETFFLGLLYINLIEVYSDSQTEDVCSRG